MKLFVSFVVIRKSAVTKKPPQAPTGHGLRWQGGSRDTAFVRTESFQTLKTIPPARKRRGAALPAALHDANWFTHDLCIVKSCTINPHPIQPASFRPPLSWTAVARRQPRHRFGAVETAGNFHDLRACESGVALRFPPQSRTRTGSRRTFVLSSDLPSISKFARFILCLPTKLRGPTRPNTGSRFGELTLSRRALTCTRIISPASHGSQFCIVGC